jgi:hypothetical protein
VGDNEIGGDKNEGKLLAISIAMAMHSKPLEAAIRLVPAPYCPGGRHGQQIR